MRVREEVIPSGSYPGNQWFESTTRYQWSGEYAVVTALGRGRCRNSDKSCLKVGQPESRACMRVWYRGCALGFQPRDTGSVPVTRSKK